MVKLKHFYDLQGSAYDPIDDDKAVAVFIFGFSFPSEDYSNDITAVSDEELKREDYHTLLVEEAEPVIRKIIGKHEVAGVVFTNCLKLGRKVWGSAVVVVESENTISKEFEKHIERLIGKRRRT